jgi:hypothetical protein
MRARAVGVDQAEFARQVLQTRQALDTIDDTSLVDLTHLAADDVRAETYQEHRTPLPAHMLQMALIVGGRYHLIEACARDAEGRLLIFPIDAAAENPGVPLPITHAADGGLRDRYGRVVEIDRSGRVRAGGDLIGRLRPPPIA